MGMKINYSENIIICRNGNKWYLHDIEHNLFSIEYMSLENLCKEYNLILDINTIENDLTDYFHNCMKYL